MLSGEPSDDWCRYRWLRTHRPGCRPTRPHGRSSRARSRAGTVTSPCSACDVGRRHWRPHLPWRSRRTTRCCRRCDLGPWPSHGRSHKRALLDRDRPCRRCGVQPIPLSIRRGLRRGDARPSQRHRGSIPYSVNDRSCATRRHNRRDKYAEATTLAHSPLEWVLLRPPGLVDGLARGNVRSDATPASAGRVTRDDVAHFSVQRLAEGTNVCHAPFVSNWRTLTTTDLRLCVCCRNWGPCHRLTAPWLIRHKAPFCLSAACTSTTGANPSTGFSGSSRCPE